MSMKLNMIETLCANPDLVKEVQKRALDMGIDNNLLYAAWYADDKTDPVLRVFPTGLTGELLARQYNDYRPLIRQGMCMALQVDDTGFTRVKIRRNGTLKYSERYDFKKVVG